LGSLIVRVNKSLENRVRELAQRYGVSAGRLRNVAIIIGLDIVTKMYENRSIDQKDLENYQLLIEIFLKKTPPKAGREIPV